MAEFIFVTSFFKADYFRKSSADHICESSCKHENTERYTDKVLLSLYWSVQYQYGKDTQSFVFLSFVFHNVSQKFEPRVFPITSNNRPLTSVWSSLICAFVLTVRLCCLCTAHGWFICAIILFLSFLLLYMFCVEKLYVQGSAFVSPSVHFI